MPIDLSSATAVVSLTGLGIICFNENKKRSETLLIHDEMHQPSIIIYQKSDNIADGHKPKKLLGYRYIPIITYNIVELKGRNRNLDMESLSIEINGVGNCTIDGYKKYESGKFNRKSLKSDLNDYRWLVNVEKDELLGSGKINRQPSNYKNSENVGLENSKLFIQNAEFFTESLIVEDPNKSTKEFAKFMRVAIPNEKTDKPIDHREYGYMADYIGAKIEANFVSVKIKIGEIVHTHLLPKTKTPYLIEIKNATSEDNSESDMPIYRSYWETKDSENIDLLNFDETTRLFEDHLQTFDLEKFGGGPGGTRKTCNLVESDAPSIEEFLVG